MFPHRIGVGAHSDIPAFFELYFLITAHSSILNSSKEESRYRRSRDLAVVTTKAQVVVAID